MTEKKNNGGSAFPSAFPLFFMDDESGSVEVASEGLSIRDWFAGQALGALLQDVLNPGDTEKEEGDSAEHPRDALARRAYAIADAMLRERAKSKGEQP